MYLNKIKLFLVISICLIIFFLTYNDVKSKEIKIISGIAKVIDGDTIRINNNKIRLFGIDAPEKKQQCQKPWLTISIFTFNKDYQCGEISSNKLKMTCIVCKSKSVSSFNTKDKKTYWQCSYCSVKFLDQSFFQASIFWRVHIECSSTYSLFCLRLLSLDQNPNADQFVLRDNRI